MDGNLRNKFVFKLQLGISTILYTAEFREPLKLATLRQSKVPTDSGCISIRNPSSLAKSDCVCSSRFCGVFYWESSAKLQKLDRFIHSHVLC